MVSVANINIFLDNQEIFLFFSIKERFFFYSFENSSIYIYIKVLGNGKRIVHPSNGCIFNNQEGVFRCFCCFLVLMMTGKEKKQEMCKI